MTDTALRAAQASGPVPVHPLEPAGAAEYLAGRDILAAAGLLAEPVRFAYYGLEEPAKDEVLGPAAARPHARPASRPRDRPASRPRDWPGRWPQAWPAHRRTGGCGRS